MPKRSGTPIGIRPQAKPTASSAMMPPDQEAFASRRKAWLDGRPTLADHFGEEPEQDQGAGLLPDQNWKLQEAAERICDPSIWSQFLAALEAWEKVGRPPLPQPIFIIPHGTMDAIEEFQRRLDAKDASAFDEDAIRRELFDAAGAVEDELTAAVRSTGISAWGRAGADGNAREGLIKAKHWPLLGGQIDIRSSRLTVFTRGEGGAGEIISQVRIRPWLHVPDAFARLAGLTLRQAFTRYVLKDAEVAAVLRGAEAESDLADQVQLGQFSARDALWPTFLADLDLAEEWRRLFHADPQKGIGQPPIPKHVRLAGTIVRDRVERILGPLRTGALTASGFYRGGAAAPVAIPAAVWSNPDGRVDFVRGDLHLLAPGGSEIEWRGITLQRTEVGHEVESAPKKGGRKPIHAWPEAFDRLVVILGEKGHPTSGANLAAMMIKCFEAMRVLPPDQRTVEKWLAKEHDHLWRHVAERGAD